MSQLAGLPGGALLADSNAVAQVLQSIEHAARHANGASSGDLLQLPDGVDAAKDKQGIKPEEQEQEGADGMAVGRTGRRRRAASAAVTRAVQQERDVEDTDEELMKDDFDAEEEEDPGSSEGARPKSRRKVRLLCVRIRLR
jgi:hypothetical protein